MNFGCIYNINVVYHKEKPVPVEEFENTVYIYYLILPTSMHATCNHAGQDLDDL